MRRVPFLMPTGRKLLCNAAMPLVLLMLAVMACPFSASAQSSGLEDGPPPPYDAPAPDATPAASTVAKPSEPAWDPLHASKSIEVGMFYKKKGNYDAAIERFEDAARLQPGLARPFLLLGEVYEKKHDSASAVTAYRKYLDLYHTAPDRENVLKRIEKLENDSNKQAVR
jgi:tetratricopeptide (TPR) repeat protein